MNETRYVRWFLWLLGAVALLRIAAIVLVPLELVPDEAYYWDWSRHLDWCYYSKPPMIAWLIAASTRLFGSHEWSVRLPAALLQVVTVSALWHLARRMYGARAGWLTALTFLAAPAATVGGLLMTIDAPLLACWSLALLCVWLALNTTGWRSFTWWSCAGVAVACGILSKQMMLAFPALTLLYVLVNTEARPALRRPGFFAFLILGLSALIPVLWWNARHDWITFQHTSSHFRGTRHFFAFVGTLGHFVATQALVFSPLVWLVGSAAGIAGLAQWRRLDARAQFLLTYAMVPLCITALASLRQRILPNWPAAFYLAACVYTAAWAAEAFALTPRMDRWRRWFQPGVVLGLIMSAVTLLAMAVVGTTGIGQQALGKRLTGWRALARTVDAAYRSLPNATNTFIMGVRDRSITSALAFYLPGQPRTYEWTYDIVIKSQYGIWQRGFGKYKRGWDALLVMHAQDRFVPQTNRFAAIELLTEHSDARGRPLFRIYLARNVRQWPDLYYRLPDHLRARAARERSSPAPH